MGRTSIFTKKTCFDGNLLCFVSHYSPRYCLVLVLYNKTNIPYLFFVLKKIDFHTVICQEFLREIQMNSQHSAGKVRS